MAKIVCAVNLGTLLQQVYIKGETFDNKNTIESYQIPLKDLPDFIASCTDIPNAYLKGPIEYIKKIEQETKEKELFKYSKIITKFHLI